MMNKFLLALALLVFLPSCATPLYSKVSSPGITSVDKYYRKDASKLIITVSNPTDSKLHYYVICKDDSTGQEEWRPVAVDPKSDSSVSFTFPPGYIGWVTCRLEKNENTSSCSISK